MTVVLVGNDWAEEHHDVELMDEAGRMPRGPGSVRALRGWPGSMR